MIMDGFLEGTINGEYAKFEEYTEIEKHDLLGGYYKFGIDLMGKKHCENIEPLKPQGWSLMVRDRQAVERMKSLTEYLEVKKTEVLSADEEEHFKKHFNKELDEIQEALRIEIHLEAETTPK